MEDNVNTIAALERVLLTVEAELTALHKGEAVDRVDLEDRLRTQISTPAPLPPPIPAAPARPAPVPPAPRSIAPTKPTPPIPPAPAAFAASTSPPSPPPPMASPSSPVPSASPIDLEKVFRLGGISLVVLAAVFFVSTAISRGWIGPTAQLALAAFASLAMIAQSFRFSKDQRPWRVTMAIGGAASLFVTGVIGHFGLELLDINATMVWLGVSSLTFLALGRAHDSQAIAASGAAAAISGTALLWGSGLATAPVLLGLGIVWALSVLVATWDQRWYVARALGGVVAAAVILMGVFIGTGSAVEVVGVAFGIAAVLAIAVSQAREFMMAAERGVTDWFAQVEARVAATTTPWATLVTAIVVVENMPALESHIGWLAVVIGLTVVTGITELSTRMHPTMSMLHQLAGFATATAGFVAVLDGPVLIAALLGQAIVTGVFALRTQAKEMIVGAGLLSSVPALWALLKIAEGATGNELTIGEIVVSGLVVVAVNATAYILREEPRFEKAWMATWGLYLAWLAAAFQGVPQTQMAISLAWAASAVLLIASRTNVWQNANAEQLRTVLNVALGTLLFTGGKLVFVDLVAVDVLWRAALFLLIGGTFLRLAFVLPQMIEEAPEARDQEIRENQLV